MYGCPPTQNNIWVLNEGFVDALSAILPSAIRGHFHDVLRELSHSHPSLNFPEGFGGLRADI